MQQQSLIDVGSQSANAGAAMGVAPAPLSPDHQIFLRHSEEAAFQIGCDRGKWRLLQPILWPQVFIALNAPARPNSPSEWVFRFDLTQYPRQAPTAGLWDVARDTWLAAAHWPFGSERFSLAFNPTWKNGQAIYLPCDRQSLEGHDHWRTQHPHLIWTPDKDLTFYLEIIHDYFHSRFYEGTRPA